ncbi:MAG: avidin/streptavidin family protein [Xanthobacteraceae bacterium]
MRRSIIAFVTLVATTVAAFAQGLPSWSVWQNQRTSIMKVFAVDQQGNFTGVYINNAQGFACQGLPGFPLTGHTSGVKVTFTVVWNNGIQNCNSKTVWSGVVQGNAMPTQWILTGSGGTQRGSDLFPRLP